MSSVLVGGLTLEALGHWIAGIPWWNIQGILNVLSVLNSLGVLASLGILGVLGGLGALGVLCSLGNGHTGCTGHTEGILGILDTDVGPTLWAHLAH